MSETYRALIEMEVYGFIEKDSQNLHEIVLYGGETFEVELKADDNDLTLDFFVTDEEDNIIYQTSAPAAEVSTVITPTEDAVYRFFVKAVNGDTDYILGVSERD
jgi:hypothetical protein